MGLSGNARASVLVFGGTTEGRELVEWLAARGSCDVMAFSATEYGSSLIAKGPHVVSYGRPLPADEMQSFMKSHHFDCVVDATHPYAAHVTGSIADSAAAAGIPLLRLVREGEPNGPWAAVADTAQAARLLAARSGNVLLTTGSKELSVYARSIPEFTKRIFARVLPLVCSLEAARAAGMTADHIIAMQGPFSKELNIALIHEFDIATLVTKASGKAGGFWEKVAATQESGTELVVIHRPLSETGLGFAACKRELADRFGL